MMGSADYDTVIIGAGPAGLSCAYRLGQAGVKTVILEKDDTVGKKVCAGGLTKKTVDLLGLPDDLIEKRADRVIFHSPFNRTVIKNDEPFLFAVDRKKLGEWQLNRLRDTKVEIRLSSRVTAIKDDHVVVNNGEKVTFKRLVGADGPLSAVRKHVGLKADKLEVSFHYIVPTDKYNDFEVFYDSLLFRSWYAWIFPHGKYVSIGCGCELGLTTGHKLRTNFNKWLKKNKIDVTNGEFRGFYVNPDHQGYRYGNIFLAGDAAGLASGLTGEGIYQALVSGDEVAELILDNSYVPRRLNALIGSNRGHARVIDVLENSGIARNVLYEIIALSFRSGYLREKALRKIF